MARKSIDYNRKSFVVGNVYAEFDHYGLVPGDEKFLSCELNAIEITGRDGDKVRLVHHSNYHPSVDICTAHELEAVVVRDRYGREVLSVECASYTPTTEIDRGYMVECENALKAYCKKWHENRKAA